MGKRKAGKVGILWSMKLCKKPGCDKPTKAKYQNGTVCGYHRNYIEGGNPTTLKTQLKADIKVKPPMERLVAGINEDSARLAQIVGVKEPKGSEIAYFNYVDREQFDALVAEGYFGDYPLPLQKWIGSLPEGQLALSGYMVSADREDYRVEFDEGTFYPSKGVELSLEDKRRFGELIGEPNYQSQSNFFTW